MMSYLITGGAGFIGSHLASFLVSRGDQVTILDNFSTGKWENISTLPVRVIEGDVCNRDSISEAVQGVDIVFHQAALCSVARSVEDPHATHAVNTTGTLNLLEECREAGVRRVVFASSSSVYGDSETLPKHEEMKTAPLSPYAISKLVGELYCQVYWKLFGLETVALRYFNVFGPRQAPDSDYAAVIPKFLHAILNGKNPEIYGDGLQTRDFTYVQNVVQANIAAATSVEAAGQIMNIACGQRWSLLELLDRISALVDFEFTPVFHEPRPGDVKHSQASIGLAEKLLGFNPQAEFEQGLQETLDWYRQAIPPKAAEQRRSIRAGRA